MTLDINGYNNVFKSFVEFAQQRVDANDAKAVIDAHVNKLGNRRILAVTQSLTDEVHKWLRTNDEYAVNDRTRNLFKKAIINMYGGESKIPASVKKAMLLGDYNCGKPLTARRIMAVKAAIDADGTAAKISLETFKSPAVKTEALNLGFKKGELPKLARAAHFYAQATGVSEMDALRAVADPGSKANRLMNYGGRFLESAQNFANGLRLMDSFAAWFKDLKDTMGPIHKQERNVRDFSPANTPTKLNVDSTILKDGNLKGLEKFVFEELASNPAHDLAGNDPERLFGFGNNGAMRFLGRGYGQSVLSTLANIPPAKRAVIYAAYDLFTKNATNAQEAHNQVQSGDQHRTQIEAANSATFLARLLRNFDKLEAMHRKGTLTARNILDKFFPDIRDKGNYDYKAVNKYLDDLSGLLYREADEGNPYADLNTGVLQTTMNNCGTTIEETAAALRAGKMPPIPKMLCTGSMELSAFDGTTKGGRGLVAADADRPSNYSITGGEQDILKGADAGFGFTFPDGTRLVTNGTYMDNIPVVCDKVEALCGRVHVAQANSVMMMLSQSGLTNLRGGIPALGVVCNEHSAVEYSLSKDDKTGAVTIRYSSPVGLPFRFSWTATVDVDGNVSTTPMVTEKPIQQLDVRAAGALVDGAAKKLGVKLTGAQKREAVQLLRTHGTNMYAKNARLFANFLVKLVKCNATPQAKTAMATETAASIREWRDFGFGDKRMATFANAAKDYANSVISDYMLPEKNNKFTDNILGTMVNDAHRAIYIFNGTTYDGKPADELLPAFKALVPDARKQKALSSWLNQLCANTFISPSNHVPFIETGVDAINLPGAHVLANRSLLTGTFNNSLLDAIGHPIVHNLQISPDGRTATITQTFTADLAAPGSNINTRISFGQVTISQRLVIDLEAEVPTVIDYKLSQTIAE
ncbi:MAG: hypothetical protein IJS08_19545 [Victivallales bacterium]|nr:hypothetical protein [Victivallales bacterium]